MKGFLIDKKIEGIDRPHNLREQVWLSTLSLLRH